MKVCGSGYLLLVNSLYCVLAHLHFLLDKAPNIILVPVVLCLNQSSCLVLFFLCDKQTGMVAKWMHPYRWVVPALCRTEIFAGGSDSKWDVSVVTVIPKVANVTGSADTCWKCHELWTNKYVIPGVSGYRCCYVDVVVYWEWEHIKLRSCMLCWYIQICIYSFQYTSIFCFSVRRKGSKAVWRNLTRIALRRVVCTVMPFLQSGSIMYVLLFFFQENSCPSRFYRLYLKFKVFVSFSLKKIQHWCHCLAGHTALCH